MFKNNDYRYETGNNIQAEEQGFLKSVGENQDALVQQGTYTYTAPDGQVITVEYTADEFGFRVKGDHIPTPPPVSPEIQKGLDLIYAGIKAQQVYTKDFNVVYVIYPKVNNYFFTSIFIIHSVTVSVFVFDNATYFNITLVFDIYVICRHLIQ